MLKIASEFGVFKLFLFLGEKSFDLAPRFLLEMSLFWVSYLASIP